MKIIRDSDSGVLGIALYVEWGIKRCNNWGCTKTPSVIVTGLIHPEKGKLDPIGLCEECFQLGNVPGGYDYKFGFGDPETEK